MTLTLDVPLESDPVLDTLLDGLTRLAEDALRGLAAGRDVLGERVRRDNEGDDALVIGRRVDGELRSARQVSESVYSGWLRSAWRLPTLRLSVLITPVLAHALRAVGPTTSPSSSGRTSCCPLRRADRNRGRSRACDRNTRDRMANGGRARRKLRRPATTHLVAEAVAAGVDRAGSDDELLDGRHFAEWWGRGTGDKQRQTASSLSATAPGCLAIMTGGRERSEKAGPFPTAL